jgi:hypothetical protein
MNIEEMNRRRTQGSALRRAFIGASLLAGMCLVAACSAPARPTLDAAQFKTYAADDALAMDEALQEAVSHMLDRVKSRTPTAPGAAPTTLHILAMSGGGDYGAFGAGFLVGWGDVKQPDWQRPQFDAVTGVSTGAMLAPFAYVGTDESFRAVETFYRNPKKDWIVERGLLFFLPSNPSFMTLPGLSRDLREAINPEFIAKMAEQWKQGKVLAISATNLDLGRQKFWEVGSQAAAAVENGDYARVQDIMLASAAIPAVFPPVQIGDAIYGDGGVTANVFLRLDVRNPRAFLPRWKAEHPELPFPKVRYWVIINNQLQHIPKTVQLRWPDVVAPSLATSIRSATIAEVRWLASEIDYVNAVYDTDIELRVIAIPSDWRPPVPGDFKKETMDSLADLGRKLGADPKSWMLWAAPGAKPALAQ